MTRSAPVARMTRMALAVLVVSAGFCLWWSNDTTADEGDSVPTENQESDPAAPQPQVAEETPADTPKAAEAKAPKRKLRSPFKDFLNNVLTPGEKKNAPKKSAKQRPPRPRKQPKPPIKDPRKHTSATVNTDPRIPDTRTLRKAMQEARLSIEQQQWKIAVRQLQHILDVPEDAFTPGAGRSWTSLKDDARQLLGSLPAEELRAYRAAYDGVAGKQLATAVDTGDFYEVISVARRYFHTNSGQQAADIVASHYLDRGEFGLANHWFQALLQSQADLTSPPAWRAKAALAAKLSRMAAKGEQVPTAVEVAQDDAAKLGGEQRNLAVWLDEINEVPRPEAALTEWPMYMGNARRTGIPDGGEPLLLSRWHAPLTRSHRIETQIQELVEDLGDEDFAMMPSLIPLMVDGKLVYRTLRGVRVADAATGAPLWETQDRVSAESLLSNENLDGAWRFSGRRMIAGFRGYMSQSFAKKPLANLLFEDANYGIISSDGRRLFVIEDLALLTKQPQQHWGSSQESGDRFGQDWSSNKIVAYDLNTGRPQWEIGGTLHGDTFELPLAGYFFHGAPVADGNELFVVGENERLIELICLEAETGKIRWKQAVAQSTAKIERDIARRWYGGQVAVGNGTIICQTTTGIVAAVERRSHALLWSADAAQLRKSNINQMRGRKSEDVAPAEPLNKRWFPTPPIIAGNRVVVTAPRSGFLYCFDLITGSDQSGRGWKTSKGKELLYLAGVFDQRVVVVGKRHVKCFALDNGFDQDWNVDLPSLPSGRGVAVAGRYYVPCATGELVGIDLDTGSVVESLTRPAGSRGLGNLALYRGAVISLSPFGVESFEQRHTIEQEIAERKKRDPHDPVALLREAEIAELNRDVTTVLDRVRTLNAKTLTAVDQARFHDLYIRALSGLIQSDFFQHDDAVAELQQLANTRDERQAYLRLTADRLVSRGEIDDAFEIYVQLAASIEPSMIQHVADSPMSVREDFWLSGRIIDLWSQIPAAGLPAFDSRVATLADEVAAGSVEEQQQWLTLFGFHPAALKIQQQLVEHYANNGNLVAAENLLDQIRDQSSDVIAAQAVRRKAEVLLSAGAGEAAADAYAELEQRFATTQLPDGKTAAEVAQAARAEKSVPNDLKRHLSPDWGNGPLAAVRMGHSNSQQDSLLPLDGLDHDTPFFSRHQLHVRSLRQRLEIVRGDSDNYLASIPLRGESRRENNSLTAYSRGHHVLLVNQGMLHSLSPLEKKVRWVQPVEAAPQQNATYQAEAGMKLQMKTSFDTALRQRGGRQPKSPYVFDVRHFVWRSGRQLTAVDTLTGDVCWTMDNVPSDALFFGGDGLLYQQEGKNKKDLVAIRMLDGKRVDLPHLAEFTSGLSSSRAKRFVGRYALFTKKSGKDVRLSLRDPLNGEEVWNRSFPNKSLSVLGNEHQLLVVTPDGDFSRLNLKSGALRKLGEVDPDAWKRRRSAYCLVDNENAYLIIDWGSRRSSERYGSSMTTIRVLGKIFAFNLDDPSQRWVYEVNKPRLLMLSGLRDAPMLVLALPQSETVGRRPRQMINKVNLVAISKRDGEQVLDATLHMQSNFQKAHVNLPGKYIELQTHSDRVRLMPMRGESAAANAQPSE